MRNALSMLPMWSRRSRAAAAGLLAALCTCYPMTRARAYVRTRNANGTPIAWERSCVFLTSAPATCPDGDPAAVAQAIRDSVAAWNDAADSCNATIHFELSETDGSPEPGFDPKGKNENLIVWLTDHWGSGDTDYEPSAVALTTLTYVTDEGAEDDGEILDADIELNGVYQHFTTNPVQPTSAYDVANTVTHELGHVLGLDHTCYDGSLPERPTDDQGRPIPDCIPVVRLPPEVRNATMYPFASPGETSKRSLEPDDVKGVCGIYPPDRNAGPCEPIDLSDGCGCSSNPVQDAPLWLLVALAALAVRRRLPSSGRRS